MVSRVCALIEAGGHPARNPLLGPLARWLAARGVRLSVFDPTPGGALPLALPEADLYLLKGDDPLVLSAGRAAGKPCLNTLAATELAADKLAAIDRLVRAGLPVPPSQVTTSQAALADLLRAGARYLKPLRGAHGDGVVLAAPGTDPPPGRWLVQQPVPSDGWVIKAYGVGARVVLRRVAAAAALDAPRLPAGDDACLRALAAEAGRLLGLELYGVDLVISAQGPYVIDVNAFPGYRGVAGAAALVGGAIVRWLEEQA